MINASKGKRGRPVSKDKDHKSISSVEQGTKQGWKRKTYIVAIPIADRIDKLAASKDIGIKDLVNEAFTDLLAKYERELADLFSKPGGI